MWKRNLENNGQCAHPESCWKGDFQHALLNRARWEHLQDWGDKVHCIRDRELSSSRENKYFFLLLFINMKKKMFFNGKMLTFQYKCSVATGDKKSSCIFQVILKPL